jgi:hypothetical protein
LPSAVQPRFNTSDESLILAAYQKRVDKIEQAAMDMHLSGLTPANFVPVITRQLKTVPALPAQQIEQIPPPRNDEP